MGCGGRIYADLLLPCRLIAAAMDLAMMTAAERHCEFIAHLSIQRLIAAQKRRWCGSGGVRTANQTWPFGDEPYVLAIANAARFE
jgi:hypothetical protein